MPKIDTRGPLSKFTVLDMGVLVAGPMVGGILGDFGARVIKIENPNVPDPMRKLYMKDGIGLWSKMEDRNKLPITLNLKTRDGQALFEKLVRKSDVLVENYRPGVLERLGFAEGRLKELNPALIVCRVSGWGQTGPYRDRGSFGRIAEAFGGFAELTGEPDGPPMHSAVSLGDSLASVWAAIGILLALLAREQDGEGQTVDVGLYEPMLRQIEQQIVVRDQLGYALHRLGNENPAVPTVNTYKTADGKWFSVSNATPRTIANLLKTIGLDNDPRFRTPESQREHSTDLHKAISGWINERSAKDVDDLIAANGAVGTWVRSSDDLVNDPHVIEREMIIETHDPELGTIRMQGIVPRLSRTPGRLRHPGRPIGDGNMEVYRDFLGLKEAEIEQLRIGGVI
jgi:crotonobetainyl-CoA:carnitine CoA-transferase CaiB-like acyl-CoA transferase